MRFLWLVLLLTACTHLAQVEQGIRAHALAGGWRSDHGDGLLIGCSGAFNADLVEASVVLPGTHTPAITTPQHESGSHIGSLDEHGFTVSRFPFASVRYTVDEWPHQDAQGRVVMQAEGTRWVRTRDLPCD